MSKAREDLPEPDNPVITVNLSRGMSTSIFLRLWVRAPRTEIVDEDLLNSPVIPLVSSTSYSRLTCIVYGSEFSEYRDSRCVRSGCKYGGAGVSSLMNSARLEATIFSALYAGLSS